MAKETIFILLFMIATAVVIAVRHFKIPYTERKHLNESFYQGTLNQTVYERLLEDVDARLLQLETDGPGEKEKAS